jgi:hypothetical protein
MDIMKNLWMIVPLVFLSSFLNGCGKKSSGSSSITLTGQASIPSGVTSIVSNTGSSSSGRTLGRSSLKTNSNSLIGFSDNTTFSILESNYQLPINEIYYSPDDKYFYLILDKNNDPESVVNGLDGKNVIRVNIETDEFETIGKKEDNTHNDEGYYGGINTIKFDGDGTAYFIESTGGPNNGCHVLKRINDSSIDTIAGSCDEHVNSFYPNKDGSIFAFYTHQDKFVLIKANGTTETIYNNSTPAGIEVFFYGSENNSALVWSAMSNYQSGMIPDRERYVYTTSGEKSAVKENAPGDTAIFVSDNGTGFTLNITQTGFQGVAQSIPTGKYWALTEVNVDPFLDIDSGFSYSPQKVFVDRGLIQVVKNYLIYAVTSGPVYGSSVKIMDLSDNSTVSVLSNYKIYQMKYSSPILYISGENSNGAIFSAEIDFDQFNTSSSSSSYLTIVHSSTTGSPTDQIVVKAASESSTASVSILAGEEMKNLASSNTDSNRSSDHEYITSFYFNRGMNRNTVESGITIKGTDNVSETFVPIWLNNTLHAFYKTKLTSDNYTVSFGSGIKDSSENSFSHADYTFEVR